MTKGQYAVLNAISSIPLTASKIVTLLTSADGNWTYHRVHGILRRLEDGGWVRRVYVGYPTKWELTRAGTNRLHRAQSAI